MEYSIKQLADMADITVRTLHYYDEEGLLKPSGILSNGYRFYTDNEVELLQQILFFRELEFSITEIKEIVNRRDLDKKSLLREQKELLKIKRDRLDNIIGTIDKLINNQQMNNDDRLKPLKEEDYNKYKEEARKRWGHTDAYKQSMERTKRWTKEDYAKFKEDGKKFNQKLASLMDRDVKDKEVQDMVKLHHASIEKFYDCPLGMYRNLGEMYIADPRFTKYYDKTKRD